MNLKHYWRALGKEGQAVLAAACGTSPGYLYLIFYGHKLASPRLALRLQRHSNPRVPARRLRADVFGAEGERMRREKGARRRTGVAEVQVDGTRVNEATNV